MWLNMALDESEGVHAALRKPRAWAAEAWARLSDTARLAILQADAGAVTPGATPTCPPPFPSPVDTHRPGLAVRDETQRWCCKPAHACAAAVDPQMRAARSRALLATVAEHNAPAFSEVDADREASEYRRLADKARGHLAAVNAEPSARHATYVRGYKDALGELARMRPAYQPCLHAVSLERVRHACSHD